MVFKSIVSNKFSMFLAAAACVESDRDKGFKGVVY